MRSLSTAAALVASIVGLQTLTDPAAALSGYRWKNRPLVVFAPSNSHPALARQRSIIAGSRGGFADRDMVVVYIVGDSVSADLGAGPGLTASALRARFGVSQGTFRAILVGKDGGAKLSSGGAIAARTLFRTIDAMPMRRDEIRRGR